MYGSMGSFTENYVRCLLGISFIVVTILLVRKLAGNRMSKRFIYGIWMTIPVFMCISPFVRLPVPQVIQDVTVPVVTRAEYSSSQMNTEVGEKVSTGTNITLPAVAGVEETVAVISMQKNPVHKINITTILWWMYWSIVILCASIILWINVRFIMQCGKNRKYRCRSADENLAVYQLEGITSPFLLGRSIYIPEGMKDEEFRYAVLHEEGHFKHGDFLWIIVRYVILVLYFFHPIVWLAFRYSGYDCELACDEEVMKSFQAKERKAYGGCLLNTVEKRMRFHSGVLLSTNMKSDKSLIKERIENIANGRKKSVAAMFIAATMVVVVMGTFLIGGTEAEAKGQITSDEIQSVQARDSDVIRIGDRVQVCLEIWTRPIEETEETYTIVENGRELELSVDESFTEFIGKSVGDVVLLVEKTETTEYRYMYTILGINDETGTSYQIPDDWNYQFATKQNGAGINNPDQWSGYTKYYVNTEASSTLDPQGEFAYSPNNITIPNSGCTWSEGVDGAGIGEFVAIRQLYMGPGEETLTFRQLCIVNGCAEDEKKWQANNRVKSLRVYYEDVYMGTISLEDTASPQYIDITPLQLQVKNGREATFRFEIAEVYEGIKYDNTCITGIAINFDGNEG